MAPDLWKLIGSLALGLVVGLIARYFFQRFEKFTPSGLGSLLACILGGTVIGYLTDWLKDPIALAVYPAGLLGGIFLYRVIWPEKAPAPPPPPPVPMPTTSTSGPTFVLLEVTKTLRFLSAEGSQAHLQRVVKMRSNARAYDFWMCTISADGSITNIRVDASVEIKERIEPNAGKTDINVHFPAAVEPGDLIDVRLDYDLNNSFQSATEHLGHEVQHQTDKINLVVEFFAGRPCVSGALYNQYAGDTTRANAVERSDTGLRLAAEIRTPRLGEKYRLSWRW